MTEDAPPRAPVGFIGLGDQGLPMAVAIAEAGYPLHVWARRTATLDQLGQTPHVRHTDPGALASACDIIALCLVTDEDLLELVQGGLFPGLHEGSIVVNHATGTPSNAIRLERLLSPAGARALDAPVSGARQGAEARTLTTMVGGDRASFERCEPVFRSFSAHVAHLGGPGSGQSAKLFNNALLVMNQTSIVEVLALAVAAGLDPGKLVEVLRLGSGASRALGYLAAGPPPPKIRDHLFGLLALDMELFATAMKEQGLDASAITTRGLAGLAALPELMDRLGPRARPEGPTA